MILSHRKDLLKGDYLIDDRPKHGADTFDGEWIRFGNWNKRQFMEELSRISTVDLAELMKEEEEVQEAEKEAEPA